jgi:hypothetical protein
MSVNFDLQSQSGVIFPNTYTTSSQRNNFLVRPIQQSSQGSSLQGRVSFPSQSLTPLIETVMQWKLEAEEGENRSAAAGSIIRFLQNKKDDNLLLKDYGLKSLPDIFDDKEFDRLKGISIKGNMIRYLPSTFVTLKSLEVASLVDNLLFELPEGISNLTTLQALDVSLNPFLTEFPTTLPKGCEIKVAGNTGITEAEMNRIRRSHIIYRQ